MKKTISVIFAITCMTAFIFGQNPAPVNDVQLLELKGKVKSMKVEVYTATNKDGQIEKNKLQYKESYSYTEQGQLTEGLWPDNDGSELNIECVYDKQKGLKERGIKGKDKHYVKVVYTHDEKGNIIEENEYAKDGTLNHKHISSYDEKGNLKEEIEYQDSATFDGKTVYVYGKDNRLAEEIYYNASNKIEGKTTFLYNDKGNITDEILYDHDGQASRFAYIYDEKGRLIESQLYNKSDKLESRNVFLYNEKDFRSEEDHYQANGKLEHKHVFQYTYDGQDNWITLTIIEDDKPILITERQIHYY